MFSRNTGICLNGARRKGDRANSEFIMKVREEDRRDKILEDVFMRSTEENPYLKQIEANIALCTAVANEKRSQQNEERRIMKRRRTNENCRQLEYKLRAAYISKAVAAQRFEAEQLAVEEKAKAHQENQRLLAARLLNQENLQRCTFRAQEKKRALKSELQAQMALKEARRRQEKLEKIEDKKKMDEAVRQYKEELLKNEQIISQQKIRIKKEMDDYEELQAKWRVNQSTIGVKERQMYEESVALRVEGRRKFLQERQELKLRKALKSEEMGKANHVKAEDNRKSSDLLVELLIDERKANEDKKYAKDAENKAIERINFRNELRYLMTLKERQKLAEKNRNDELYREGMRFLAECDAKQRIKDEQKLKGTEAHREALLCALRDKKRFKVKEMKRLLMAEAKDAANTLRRKRVIGNARVQLIRDHESALRGFFVPDVMREGSQ